MPTRIVQLSAVQRSLVTSGVKNRIEYNNRRSKWIVLWGIGFDDSVRIMAFGYVSIEITVHIIFWIVGECDSVIHLFILSISTVLYVIIFLLNYCIFYVYLDIFSIIGIN